MATVGSPQALREAVSQKLGTAVRHMHDLRKALEPEFNGYWNPKDDAVGFLHAAHGVVPVLKTFADERKQLGDFDDWRDKWEEELTVEERTLWLRMKDERIAQEHGEGAGLESFPNPVTRGGEFQDFTNYAAHGIPRGPPPAKEGVRFRAYPDRPANEVCLQYLGLVGRCWQDFIRDHPHILPP